MPTKQITPGKRTARKSVSRFQRLWSEAETLAEDNAKFEKELEALVKRINEDVFTAEHRLGETIRLLVYRQLEFAHRKSLFKWHREELNDWMAENLSELLAMGLLDEPLQEKVAELRASQLGITLNPDSALSSAEQLDAHFDTEANAFDDDLNASDHRPRNTTGDLFADEEELDETFDDEFDNDELADLLRKLHAEFEESHERKTTPDHRRNESPVSDRVFRRLFQQTAAALHPDRETDQERRLEKHALMSELLKARKEHDLITIVKLHERHANADSELDSSDQQALESVLVEYLNQQRQRLDDIITQSPLHQMAFSQFYDKKPATVTRRINTHLKNINAKRQAILEFLDDVKTLAELKEVLSMRYEANIGRDDWY